MGKLGGILSSVLVTSLGVALIFRVDFLRSLVTGIQVAKPGAAAPTTGSILYM